MKELDSWQKKVINEILLCKDPVTALVDNIDFFAYLSFNRNTYSEIVNQIKAQSWEQLKLNKDKCETEFREDLTLVRFNNQDSQTCVATIYDSDELWQDPRIIDIFIL